MNYYVDQWPGFFVSGHRPIEGNKVSRKLLCTVQIFNLKVGTSYVPGFQCM